MDTMIDGEPSRPAAVGRRRRAPRAGGDEGGPGWLEAVGARGVAQVVILLLLFGWLYQDQFIRTVGKWMDPDWSHGFIIPPFCLYIAHRNRRRYLSGDHAGSYWGAVLVFLSIALYAVSIRWKIGSLQFFAPVPTLAGLILLLRGRRWLWLSLFPLVVLVMALPPPTYLYRAFTLPLQQFVARASGPVLNAFPGVDEVLVSGIHLVCWNDAGDTCAFTVAGACSGMRSLMAFGFFGLATAYFAKRHTWQRVVIVLAVAPVALFCNFVRVLVTGSFYLYDRADWATGTPHALLGFVMFGIGIGLFMGLLWIVDHLFVQDDAEAPEPAL